VLFLKHWGTDGKFFRKRKIPTIIYGTSKMAAQPNEHVLIDELSTVTKCMRERFSIFYFKGIHNSLLTKSEMEFR
jgi:protein associated with RNAse G/E